MARFDEETSSRQETYCHLRASEPGLSKTECHIRAFGPSKSRRASGNAASALEQRYRIQQRIHELTAEYRAKQKAEETQRAELPEDKRIIEKLWEAHEDAKRNGNETARVRALQLLGQQHQLWSGSERQESRSEAIKGMSSEELYEAVRSLAQQVGLRVVDGRPEAVRKYILENAPFVGITVTDDAGDGTRDAGGDDPPQAAGVSSLQ